MKYTIKSTSDEGIFYLVNGWTKYNTFWISEEEVKKNKQKHINKFFNKPSHAKASLTKLLKIMKDYRTDKFELVEIQV